MGDSPNVSNPADADDADAQGKGPGPRWYVLVALVALVVSVLAVAALDTSHRPPSPSPKADVMADIAKMTDCMVIRGEMTGRQEAAGTMDPGGPEWSLNQTYLDALELRLDEVGCKP